MTISAIVATHGRMIKSVSVTNDEIVVELNPCVLLPDALRFFTDLINSINPAMSAIKLTTPYILRMQLDGSDNLHST